LPSAIPINRAALTPVRHADSPLTAQTGPAAGLTAKPGTALPKVSFFDD
jgi:hypothetical protein